ncbi:hypothetical protein OsJ_04050 [Oryza sativa Japonica Group]|uniref:S-acyltransferase n=1 Tax=Oryza sativa subsp. japonica TaxID=39947 RepID=B9EUD6_ORYSJ|nr:hypothetical protein OsJ_04050 [Oryza sativa Japonica Group]
MAGRPGVSLVEPLRRILVLPSVDLPVVDLLRSYVLALEDILLFPVVSNETLMIILGGDLRYCQKCSHYKPPRAHHCRVCKRCVLRMDHHCIWINNCVGHENYKIFLVFVLYAVVASLYSLVLVIGGAVHSLPKNEQLGSDSSRTSIIICGVFLCPLALALSILLGWHVYLIFHNKTTIEYHEGVRAMWLAEKAGNLYHHPYDLGVYENLVSVLGPNALCWLCPISRNTGNGIRFRTSYDIPLSTPPI